MVSGPSGAGKGTLVKELLARYPQARLSISATTRKPRRGEEDGRDYFFLSEEEFRRHLAEDSFLEWAEVYGNLYGTFREQVEQELERGNDVILEIDVQGALQVAEKLPEAVMIFVYHPSLEELERRLRARNTDDEETISRRLRKARWEIEQGRNHFHYEIINHDLDEAIQQMCSVYERESESFRARGGGATEI